MHHDNDDPISNPCQNPHFDEILQVNLKRRQLLAGGVGAALVGFFGVPGLSALTGVRPAGAAPIPPSDGFGGIGFDGIAPNNRALNADLIDDVRLPDGYSYEVLYAWGDPIGAIGQVPGQPAWKDDAGNTAAEQTLQAGTHHDGMHYFPRPGRLGSTRGLLCINHEYTDPLILTPDGMVPWTLEKVRKAQHAHGVSVVEVWRHPRTGRWEVKRPSPFARRIHGNTPDARSPARPPAMTTVKTAADPTGTRVLGTLNNCAHGYTPWGTYLTCEENWNGYFSNPTGDVEGGVTEDQKPEILAASPATALPPTAPATRWHLLDERFRADLNPNEPNRFGYIVEIDPYSPRSCRRSAPRSAA
jgi:uncharacterized protein